MSREYDKRGLITEAQREIVGGMREDVDPNYRKQVRHDIRTQIRQAALDLQFLGEHDDELYGFAVNELCGETEGIREELQMIKQVLEEQGLLDD